VLIESEFATGVSIGSKEIHGSRCGCLVATINGQRAFVPDPLPRQPDLNSELVLKLDVASHAVANLAGVGETVQNPHLLIRPLTTTLSSKLSDS